MANKRPQPWKPISHDEKDFFSHAAATKVLLAYIDSLELTVVDLRAMHLADREQISKIKRQMMQMQTEIDRLTGKRVFTLTPDEEVMFEIEQRQEKKKAERARRRIQQREAAKMRTREADRIIKNRQSKHVR